MIDAEKRKAIYRLHQEGMGVREMSRRLGVSRNIVRKIIKQKGSTPTALRKDKIELDPDLLRTLYKECDGYKERVYEKLQEQGHEVGYSTLTRTLRDLGIGPSPKPRCDRVPDEPGAEMQHDTTVYQVPLGGRRSRLIASVLYLRYAKRRYLKFYRSFNPTFRTKRDPSSEFLLRPRRGQSA